MNHLIGAKIGSGTTRDVFTHKFSSDLVIKVERGKSRHNIAEHMIWNNAIGDELEHWLSPIFDISETGKFLVMNRTVSAYGQFINRIPQFFSDMDVENFGILEGTFVCHDYAESNLFTSGLDTTLVTPQWSRYGIAIPIDKLKDEIG